MNTGEEIMGEARAAALRLAAAYAGDTAFEREIFETVAWIVGGPSLRFEDPIHARLVAMVATLATLAGSSMEAFALLTGRSVPGVLAELDERRPA